MPARLPRLLAKKTKEVRDRLGPEDKLPSVTDAQAALSARMTPTLRRHVEASRERFREESAKLGERKIELTKRHRAARVEQDERQRREREGDARTRAAKLPRGLAGLWHRLTGQYAEQKRHHEANASRTKVKQTHERQALIDRQRDERAPLQAAFKNLRARQAAELSELRREIGRFVAMSRNLQAVRDQRQAQSQGRARSLSASLSLKLER